MGVMNSAVAVGAVAVVAYLMLGMQQLYKLMNPLEGLEVVGPTIDPLWSEGQKFDFFAFLSTKNRLASIDPSFFRTNDTVIIERRGLVHSSTMQEQRLTETIHLQSMSSSIAKWMQDISDQIHGNGSSVFLHVVLCRSSASHDARREWPHESSLSSIVGNRNLFSSGDALHGAIRLIKYNPIPQSFHHKYLLSDFNLVELTDDEKRKLAMPKSTVIAYWKPEVAVKLVSDFQRYPHGHLPPALHRNTLQVDHSQYKYKPALHVDEIGLTSDKYLPLFGAVQTLPLTISLGPMSSQRWILMSHLEPSLRAQKNIGFSDKDLDDVRRLIADTSVGLLTATIVASVLHTLFEVLAFQSDISFWKKQDKHVGISLRSLIWSLVSQVVVLLYLMANEASLLVVAPAACGIAIQIWKTIKAWGSVLGGCLGGLGAYLSLSQTRLAVIEQSPSPPSAKPTEGTCHATASATLPPDSAPSSCEVTTMDTTSKPTSPRGDKVSECPTCTPNQADTAEVTSEMLARMEQVTAEADAFAYKYVGLTLAPIVGIFIIRSLIYEKHHDWFMFFITSLAGCEYTFGFVLMIPQLYINHRLQSVSHLPWKYLAYKFVNTFIDDLFAFVIKMPTVHRIAVFRDDIVFLIYLYQRYIYKVDQHRPIEK